MMTKKQTSIIALAGAALLAVTQAQAAGTPSDVNFNDGDLLLNFRNSVTDSGSDATFDLGNVNTFVSATAALSGQTAVLDSGTGYATSTYPVQFSGATLITKISQDGSGTADDIGFSAAAENLSATGTAANTLWLTRQITGSQLLTGGTGSRQQGATPQINTANAIQLIGQGAESSTRAPGVGAGAVFTGALNGGLVADGNANSYHTLAQDGSSADLITFGGSQNGTSPSAIEATPASGTVYEALWQVPQGSGTAGDIYKGYFTFQQDGEVDFTQVSAVPEPPTYALFAATALVAFALRRQFRSLTA